MTSALSDALGGAEPLALPLSATLALPPPPLALALADAATLGDGSAEPEPPASPVALADALPAALAEPDTVDCSDAGIVTRGDGDAVALLAGDAVGIALCVAGAEPLALTDAVDAALPVPPAREAVAAPVAVDSLLVVAPRDAVARVEPLAVKLTWADAEADAQPLDAADTVELALVRADAVADGDADELRGADTVVVLEGTVDTVAAPLALAAALDDPELAATVAERAALVDAQSDMAALPLGREVLVAPADADARAEAEAIAVSVLGAERDTGGDALDDFPSDAEPAAVCVAAPVADTLPVALPAAEREDDDVTLGDALAAADLDGEAVVEELAASLRDADGEREAAGDGESVEFVDSLAEADALRAALGEADAVAVALPPSSPPLGEGGADGVALTLTL